MTHAESGIKVVQKCKVAIHCTADIPLRDQGRTMGKHKRSKCAVNQVCKGSGEMTEYSC